MLVQPARIADGGVQDDGVLVPVVFAFDSALPLGAAFTRASTAFADTTGTGAIVSHAVDAPRFAVEGGITGILIEPAWVNIEPNSEDLSSWTEQAAGGDAPVVTNLATPVAPDGTQTADTIEFAGAGAPDVGRSHHTLPLTNGDLYMTAVYIRQHTAPHDFRIKNPNSAAGVVNGVATAAWVKYSRLDTVVGTVEGLYIRRDSSGAGGKLQVWGGVRYANQNSHLYEYHPGTKAADVLKVPCTGLRGSQGSVGCEWVPKFAASTEISYAASHVFDIAGTNFSVIWNGADNPSYLRLRNNGANIAEVYTKHAAGDRLRITVHYGGMPTRAHLEINGWAVKAQAAWVAPTIPAQMSIGSDLAGANQSWCRVRKSWAYRSRRRFSVIIAALGDSISSETAAGEKRWMRYAGAQIEGRGYYLDAGVNSEKFADFLARVQTAVIDQGVTDCFVLGGVNDLVGGRTLQQMKDDAQAVYDAIAAVGIRVRAGTILPFKGNAGWTAGRETIKDDWNTWLLAGRPNVVEALDTGTALADPGDTEQLLPAYDSGDHTHPNAAGAQVLGEYIHAQGYA